MRGMLRSHGRGLALVCLLLGAPAAPAQQALDLIPEDAAFGVVAPSLAGLRDKGDKLIADTSLRLNENMRPSALFKQLFDFLKIHEGLDEQGSVAVLFPNFKKMKIQKIDLGTLFYVHFAVPFTDLDKIASNFGFKPGQLKPGKVRFAKGKFVFVKDQHLYVAFRKEPLDWVAKGKPVTGALSTLQRSVLAKSDLAVHFGPEAWGALWKAWLAGLDKQLHREGQEQDSQVGRQFVQALSEVRFVVAGLRLEDGLGLNVIASFPKADAGGEAAAKFLNALRAGPGASDLSGLPRADPLFAYAAKGDGESNVGMVHTLLSLLFDGSSRMEQLLPRGERQKFLGAFETMYRRLKGSRAAVYANRDRTSKLGEVCTIAILDIDDPATFLGQWPKVIDIANKAAARTVQGTDLPAPKLAFTPAGEMLDGTPVDLLTFQEPALKAEDEQTRRRLLGPDWNKLRMAVQGKAVVLLVGSDRNLFRETLDNLKKGVKGLPEQKVVSAALARLAPERKLELHANLKNGLPFLMGDGPAGTGPLEALTSLALAVEPERVQLEIVVPVSEVKAFVQARGLDR